MTMLKILSAGLIATAMLTTAASARKNLMNERHNAQHADHAGQSTTGRLWMLEPPAGAYTETPTEQPGGICDHGDNPQIC